MPPPHRLSVSTIVFMEGGGGNGGVQNSNVDIEMKFTQTSASLNDCDTLSSTYFPPGTQRSKN